MAGHEGSQGTETLSPGTGDRGADNHGRAGEELGSLPGGISVRFSDNGHLVLLLPPGGIVTESIAEAAAGAIQHLAGTRTLPLLLILTGVESISRSARDVFSAARSLSAVAVLGVSPVDLVIANFLLGGDVQPCPTRYFSSEADALCWLKRFV